MKFSRELSAAVTIKQVTDNSIRIGERDYRKTLALTSTKIIADWPVQELKDLTVQHLQQLLYDKPELIVLGTGATQRFPPRELIFAMARDGIGIEAMTTAAAARTFNVLVGEGRNVASLLYLENDVDPPDDALPDDSSAD